jgi:hypothetical protein
MNLCVSNLKPFSYSYFFLKGTYVVIENLQKILVMVSKIYVNVEIRCMNKKKLIKKSWEKLHNNKSKVKKYFLVKLKVIIGVGWFLLFLRTRDSSSKESF